MAAVELQGIAKDYGHVSVLKDVNLQIENNSFAVILGSPASGKSVLMRLITGLEKPTSGQVLLRGKDVSQVSPGERNIGYVPQSFALYPHFKVYDNIAYPLKLMGVHKSDIDPIVRQTAELLRISPLLAKIPDQLSGGEKQRVAIARGIVKNTEIFIMDDPLTGLDYKLREQLFDDLKNLQETLQATIVYTTSDPLEALMLADRIHILHAGRIVDAGELNDVYQRPAHLQTLNLLGFPSASMLPGQLQINGEKAHCQTDIFEFSVELESREVAADNVIVGVRPQDILLDPHRDDTWLSHEANIVLREDLGGELVIYLEVNDTSLVSVIRYADSHLIAEDRVTINIQPSSLTLFDRNSGQRIGQGRA